MRFLFLIYYFPLLTAFAQGNLRGIVNDETNQPIPGAHAVLKGSGTGALTGQDGVFQINKLKAGSYSVEVSYVGFNVEEAAFEIRNNETTELSILGICVNSQ